MRSMDADTWWYIRACAIFIFFNIVAVSSVLISYKKEWRVDLIKFRHYFSLVFQICGIIYALFLGFIVWDVWERFYDVKKMIQNESKYLVDIYRDSVIYGEKGALIRTEVEKYLDHVIQFEWRHMEDSEALKKGDLMINNIWNTYYAYTPVTEKEGIWYAESLRKMNEFTNARLTRIFNNSSSVGLLRWILLIGGGIFLVSVPCFFKVELLFFSFFLAFFLANIIAFMLLIIFSLDHPFVGYVEIAPKPMEYALDTIHSISLPTFPP